MRLRVLLPLAVLIGLGQLLLRDETFLPFENLRAEWLFLLALHTAMHAPERHALPAFWWCGVMGDLFLGSRLGASTLLYSVLALAVTRGEKRLIQQSASLRMAIVLGAVLVINLARPFLEYGLRFTFSRDSLQWLLASAAWTALLTPVAGLMLDCGWLRTWREAPADFGLRGR
jgi:rod shape-determining protein MreD